MNVIEFKNIYKKYDNHEVFTNFSLEIPSGLFITIIGTSGSGKTTLLRMINALEIPDSGKVILNGEDLTKKSKKELIQIRRKIGYAIQGDGLFPHLNIEENISYVPNLLKLSKDKTKEKVNELMSALKLDTSLLKRYPAELSGGQRQRVGIARAMCGGAKVLLMDEPFGALDELTKKSLQDEIKSLQQRNNLSIIFVTHDIKEALKLGDLVLILNAGKIEYYGKSENILQNTSSEFARAILTSAGAG